MMCRLFDPVSGREVSQRLRKPFTDTPYQGSELSPDPDPSVAAGGDVSLGDIHSPLASTAPTVDPPSDADLGGLGTDDGDSIGDIGQGPSGIIPSLTDPAYDLPTPTTELPTSAIAGTPPWHTPPKPYTTPTTQVW
jgi:hypothetical protein